MSLLNNSITEKPLVSIGIPVYNAEKFLKLAVVSVLNQNYDNFELIITDDGSTDDSVQILKDFHDSRIKLIVDGSNKGISYRLNQQIELASGKYFFRMDADDIMFKDRVEKQIDFLEKNEDFDVVGTPVVIINDENEVIGYRNCEILTKYKDLFSKNLYCHPSVAGKIEWFKANKYDEQLCGAEDYNLWLSSYQNSKFGLINEPLIFYRDPLEFKLKTYLFRLDQQRKIFKNNFYLKENLLFKNKLLFLSYLKGFLAVVLNFFRLDKVLISRRNSKFDILHYSCVLKKMLAKN